MPIKRLPTVAVTEDFYELLRRYAFDNKLSISGAVRKILLESPDLAKLAEEQGKDLSALEIGSWGGSRTATDEHTLEQKEVSAARIRKLADRLEANLIKERAKAELDQSESTHKNRPENQK